VARGIELDWVVVRVHSLRRTVVVVVLGLVAAAAVLVAYTRLNMPPDARARRAIERAETVRAEATSQPVPAAWQLELEDASSQLQASRAAYAEERWEAAEQLADSARNRFAALIGSGEGELVGVGEFFSLAGRVQVQRAGQGDWEAANLRMPVFNGDFVRCGRDGSAEILFADGTLYRIAPNSLLEIHHRSATADSGGAVKMKVGRINVYTSTASSTISTDAAATEVDSDSRVAVDVPEGEGGRTTVAAYEGAATVQDTTGGTVRLATREAVAAEPGRPLGAKVPLPDPPAPEEPLNNATFNLARDREIRLQWQLENAGDSVHLQVSRGKRFTDDELDVDAHGLSRKTARLRIVAPGTYFWRVATVTTGDVRSDWSPVRRFRIESPARPALLEDRTPPLLEVNSPQQLGHLFIVEGRTEPGADVTVNGEHVEPDATGAFRKAVEFRQDGWNELVVIARDPSGNPTEHRERVYVEVF
jgi:hypothetical protein